MAKEVKLLQEFAGEASMCPLVRITYTSGLTCNAIASRSKMIIIWEIILDHVYSNGCRAVPWRQVHGDICYLLIETHDKGELSVTASTFGCYINGVRHKDEGTLEQR